MCWSRLSLSVPVSLVLRFISSFVLKSAVKAMVVSVDFDDTSRLFGKTVVRSDIATVESSKFAVLSKTGIYIS